MNVAIFVIVILVLLLLLVVGLCNSRIGGEYERGVVFRLGRLIDLRGPAHFCRFLFRVHRLTKVEPRVGTLDVPPQEVITSDNVTVNVKAVILFQVLDTRAATTPVHDYAQATSQIAQTTPREVPAQEPMDERLSSRAPVKQKVATTLAADGSPRPVRGHERPVARVA